LNIRENIKIAFISIKTNLLRSLLTMLGIIIGVGSVIAVITIGTGGRDYIVNMIKEMGGSTAISIVVNRNKATVSDYITEEDIKAIKNNLDDVDYISPVVMSIGAIQAGEKSGIGMGIGTNVDIEAILGQSCVHGRLFNYQEYLAGRNVAVIDAGSAYMLYGKENVVGESIDYTFEGKTVSFKIIGVMSFMSAMGGDAQEMFEQMQPYMESGQAMGGAMLLIPSTVATSLLGTGERYDSLYLKSRDDSLLESIGEAAVNILYARHNNSDREIYTATNLATFIDLLDKVITVFTLFIASVGAISLVVGGIGVMNIMLVTVTERTREIGIRKALGAKTKTIMLQFLTEAVIICLTGGLLGLALGTGLAAMVSMIMDVPLSVKFSTVLIAVGFSSAIGIFFGLYPAKRAAEMPPIEALRVQ
jgi:putative ABC transport system permease protein